MKKILVQIILVAAMFQAVGCKITRGKITRTDGSQARFTDARLGMSTRAKTVAKYNPETGEFEFDADIASDPQADLIEAATRGVASGLTGRAPVPAPANEPQPEPEE